ncbi:hypothetical protein ACVMYR_05435 [Micromonospora sp. PTRAS2]
MSLLKGLAAMVLVAAGLVPTSPAQAKGRAYPVRSLDYTLGDSAFTVAGFHTDGPDSPTLAPIELTGNVHYPATGNGPFPLVVLSHGYWGTCADRAADAEAARIEKESPDDYYDDPRWLEALHRLWQWPCAPGVAALPSYRGYDYLAQQLAAQGMIVISISANGINAGQIGTEADNARSKLINKHLALWTELARTGRGALAGHFSGPEPDFRGKIDFSRTGTLGHSRGGRAVAWHAADVHRTDLPAGVRLAGVLALAAAGSGTATNPGSPDAKLYRVTSAPLAVWVGGCDSEQGLDYARLATGHTRKPIYTWHVRGANHNFLNTQWSPESGQVGATDDQGFSPEPGWCGTPTFPDWDPDSGMPEPPIEWSHVTRKLTETEQRQVSAGYVTAFFRSALLGDQQAEAVISGCVDPYASFTVVDAEKIDPQLRRRSR